MGAFFFGGISHSPLRFYDVPISNIINQNDYLETERNYRYMDKKATPEKRMELARYIREQNMGNRWKLRQREQILYGKEIQTPLFDKNPFAEQGGYNAMTGRNELQSTTTGSFKYRMTLAVLLFVGFLLCDTNQGKILTFSTNEVYEMIQADSLHLYDGSENAVMEELTGLFE